MSGSLHGLARGNPIGQANSGVGHQFVGPSEPDGGLGMQVGQVQLGLRCFRAPFNPKGLLHSGMSCFGKGFETFMDDTLKISLSVVHLMSTDKAFRAEAARRPGSLLLSISSFINQAASSSLSEDGLDLKGYTMCIEVAPLRKGSSPLRLVLVNDS